MPDDKSNPKFWLSNVSPGQGTNTADWLMKSKELSDIEMTSILEMLFGLTERVLLPENTILVLLPAGIVYFSISAGRSGTPLAVIATCSASGYRSETVRSKDSVFSSV